MFLGRPIGLHPICDINLVDREFATLTGVSMTSAMGTFTVDTNATAELTGVAISVSLTDLGRYASGWTRVTETDTVWTPVSAPNHGDD